MLKTPVAPAPLREDHPLIRSVQRRSVALLVAAALLNDFDRSALAVANPLIRADLHLSVAQMGLLLSAFLWAYAFAQLPIGYLLDRIGPKRALGGALVLWSAAQAAGGLMTGLGPFVAVRALLGQYAPQVSAIAALSTVPSLLRELRLLLDRRTDLPSVVVGPGVRTGVPLLVDNPREVGADRVVNTLAAHQLCGTACIVVDFGTSTNIDVVSERGEFLGGALAPGIEISMEALADRAAALRTVELVPPRSVIGKNTVECLQSGVLYGFAGQVDGLVRRILAELGAGPVTVLGTGGLAPLMTGESETITSYVPDLTLLGLRLTYLRNAATPRRVRE